MTAPKREPSRKPVAVAKPRTPQARPTPPPVNDHRFAPLVDAAKALDAAVAASGEPSSWFEPLAALRQAVAALEQP